MKIWSYYDCLETPTYLLIFNFCICYDVGTYVVKLLNIISAYEIFIKERVNNFLC